MLGPDLPRHPPVGTAAREGFVRSALALALHVRAPSWNASPEGWAATLVTDLAYGDETLETAVKVGKYIQETDRNPGVGPGPGSPSDWAARLGGARGVAQRMGQFVLSALFLPFVLGM
ncbi:hypothetical protein CP975_00580 [Streptomyces alboniger]|uniref:Uncharacterized protein n=2 Tax=Streptomyces alboniger TaxID=132473 RepID=A0A5J6HCK9_STRAD|nr:hypothetical protein CP975_00580 [Streptomyces alboniger]